MQSNKTVFAYRRRTIGLLLLFLAAAGTITVASFSPHSRRAQGASTMNISVQDPRPLAKAIEILEARCGCVITYEDPRYAHDSEISDVTESVRKDLDQFRPGEAPRVFIPKGGVLAISYNVVPTTNQPADPAVVVQQLFDMHAVSGNAGRFRLERSGRIIHVIPTAVKNRAGDLASQESMLDALITLPAKERTGEQTLKAICEAIGQATQTRVLLGTIPTNLFLRYRDQQGATNEKARDVLVDLLDRVNSGRTNLSWQLFYDPGLKLYVLNIHLVPTPNG